MGIKQYYDACCTLNKNGLQMQGRCQQYNGYRKKSAI